ncbi:hypothetical protein [Mycolicibacterium fortuitum]
MIISSPTGEFSVDRTRSGKIRLARKFDTREDSFFMLTHNDSRAVSAGILRVLEGDEQVSVRLDIAPPVTIQRQSEGLRLERYFRGKDERVWISASESAAADIAIALADAAGQW